VKHSNIFYGAAKHMYCMSITTKPNHIHATDCSQPFETTTILCEVIHYSRIKWIHSIFRTKVHTRTQTENHEVKSITRLLQQLQAASCRKLIISVGVALSWQPWGKKGGHARASQHLRRVPENRQHTVALCYQFSSGEN
jgi:hypothetical protein